MAVYTIQKQTNHDYSPAEVYGDINTLFPLGVNVTDVEVISKAARVWFKTFNFQEDYFLPIGNPAVVAIVSMCLLEELFLREVSEADMLEWDKHSRAYVCRTFYLGKEMEEY